mgnify:CR=1 FL=1
MSNETFKEESPSDVLRVAVDAGRLMLEAGAETYRAEETIAGIAQNLGALKTESFALPTGIMASTTDVYGHSISTVRRIRTRSINLEKISKLEALTKTSNSHTLDDLERELCIIETISAYPQHIPFIGSALISGFFCILFGGATLDALCAALAGALLNIGRRWLASKRQPDFILNVAGGLYAALISALLVYVGIARHLDKTSIGIIMLMVPGVTIVNAIRDLISGDLVAGIARAADAFISAAGISIGVGIGLQIWSTWIGMLP